jgi:hypothetical protein
VQVKPATDASNLTYLPVAINGKIRYNSVLILKEHHEGKNNL